MSAARLVIPPTVTVLLMLLTFYKYKMYPFGTASLSWCDMTQQTVPLLEQFKDILDGGGNIFYSLKNSGGMEMYGVFFFFLSSPFTFLVKFVPKEDMLMFMNILVMLKMAVCAFTASLCLMLCRKKLDAPSAVLLSVIYPFSGFVMMYYQNLMWLDMVYLFPLLITALYRITKRQKPLMYIIVLSAMMTANYYICYMIVIFIMLFMFVYTSKNKDSEYAGRICRDVIIGSGIAALLTAVVWLPSFLQYASSGRGETGVIETLASSNMVTNYFTTLPMLMCTALPIVLTAADVFSSRQKSPRNRRTLLLLALTLIPFFAEPINKMWHTGNYMSFPCRFGFITIFLFILCAAHSLEQETEQDFSAAKYFSAGFISLIAIFLVYSYSGKLADPNSSITCNFSDTLWGDQDSFRQLMSVFIAMVFAYAFVYFLYKKGYIFKKIFLLLSAALFIVECSSYTGVYMAHPSVTNAETHAAQSRVFDLSDRIDDDNFYRVKSYSKLYNNNMIGALGYNTLSHYTSLNERDNMFTMKRLGYSGVWMETTAVGGTRLTDALLSMNYEINGGASGEQLIYESKAGRIFKLPEYLPMGLLLEKGTLDECAELPEKMSRSQLQGYLSSSLFGEDITQIYQPVSEITQDKNGAYSFKAGDMIEYRIDVTDECSIYFDCFDKLTNHLTEPVFDSFSIMVNGNTVRTSYPTGNENGLLRLGDYSDCSLNIRINCKKDIKCSSFGLFGLDVKRLQSICSQAQGVGLKEKDGCVLAGSCILDDEQTCFVSLPYNEEYTVSVNGSKAEYKKAFSDFICFDLPKGKSEIEITYTPKGFAAGVFISIIGAAALAAYIAFAKKLDRALAFDKYAAYIMTAASALVFAAVYIFPMLVNIIAVGLEK